MIVFRNSSNHDVKVRVGGESKVIPPNHLYSCDPIHLYKMQGYPALVREQESHAVTISNTNSTNSSSTDSPVSPDTDAAPLSEAAPKTRAKTAKKATKKRVSKRTPSHTTKAK